MLAASQRSYKETAITEALMTTIGIRTRPGCEGLAFQRRLDATEEQPP